MNKKNYTIKDYRKELKGIYRIKDISQFKQEIKKLYSKKEIRQSWKSEKLEKLLIGNKKLIDVIVLIVSKFLSALITTEITFNGRGDIRSKGFNEILAALGIVCLTFFIVEAITLSFSLFLILPFVTSLITSKDIERSNIEINEIIKNTKKQSLSALFDKEKESKKKLAFRLIFGTLTGVTIPLVTTAIVLFIR